MREIRLVWRSAFLEEKFRKSVWLSLIFLAIVLTGFYFVLAYAEARKGIVIEKGWLNFAPVDFSVAIFLLTYGVAITGLVYLSRKPASALLFIQSYLLVQFARGIALLLVPLDPPENIIPLSDPFLQSTFYAGRPNLKDLFFSGHMATTCLFIFVTENRRLKIIFIAAGIFIAVFMIVQRVHYISDILVAPSIAWFLFGFAKKRLK
jgi:hypothetical protein